MPILNAGHTVAEHKTATRTRILAAFAEVLVRDGWDGASIKAVATQAGLTRTVLYNYFADKSQMLLEWSALEIERFLARIDQETVALDDPRHKLEAVVELVLREFAGPHPVTPPVMSLIPNQTALEFTSQLNELEDVVFRILTEGEQVGVFRLVDARSASRCILGCLDPHRQALAEGGPVDEVIAQVVPFVMGAVGAGPTGVPDPHPEASVADCG
ncbi:TetR/AcrR family transcriptional regulator [Nocardia higoensis]|uniref:TetR/AcrR family transcriptional regulator n=1 Tax=Nocardia higoensis TaxID=228599 RepID=A0ABS0D5H7_9NOCA|nr:TetR/AcrR family transcriptional regulator [Nocardia higoensis]MBF6353725.1 TetR/AcrR family transcriptional regulator [Nocardia higoensis]